MNGCHYRRLGADGDGDGEGVPPAEQAGGLFEATDLTRSNWSWEIQHGSPPLALMTRAIENLGHREHPRLRIGRLSMDILGAIPVAPVRVRARVDRPGKRIALLSAEMIPDGGDRAVARVSAWLLATNDTGDVATDRFPPLVEGQAVPFTPIFGGREGYLEAFHWRPQPTVPNEAQVYWGSPMANLVDIEEASPLCRLALVADTVNGVGAALDARVYTFMNTDTVVHVHRLPVGNDFALRSRGSIGPDGIGVTSAELFDRQGFIATCAQTLLVQRN